MTDTLAPETAAPDAPEVEVLPAKKPRPPRVIIFVAVYRIHQPANTEPAYHVPRAIALQMMQGEDPLACSINRGKALRLNFCTRPDCDCDERHLYGHRGESCHPSEATMDAALSGSKRARIALLSWEFVNPVFSYPDAKI